MFSALLCAHLFTERKVIRAFWVTGLELSGRECHPCPSKATDLRSGCWSGETYQLEALSPTTLVGILYGAISWQLGRGILAEDCASKEEEHRQIAWALSSVD